MLDELKDWIEAILGPSWVYSTGMWTDRPDIAASPICSIQNDGGPQPDVDDRRPRFRVILLGPIQGAVGMTKDAADALTAAALSAATPCGAAHIRIAEPTGPGTTTEGRRWYALDIEILF